MGRIASQFYIKYDTIEIFNEFLKSVMNEADILSVISQSTEFSQLKVWTHWLYACYTKAFGTIDLVVVLI